jgi:hypothetical protein
MNLIWISSTFWLSVGASALAGGSPCPPEVTSRFPPAQAKVLCGEEAPDYSGTGYGGQSGSACITRLGSCPLDIVRPQGAPCECSLKEGRVAGFIIRY